MKFRPAWLIWIVAAVGVGLLVIDHWAHVFGVLPYVVLLACPLMHVFMHRSHGGHANGARHEHQPPKAG